MSLELLLPGVEEQTKIGRLLDGIDNLITLHQRKYEKFVNIKKALLEKMFPQGDEKVPRIRFKGFTDAWEQRKVGELLEERDVKAPKSREYPLMAFIANEGVAPKGDRYDRSALVNDTENKPYKQTELGDFIYSSNNLETGSIGLNKYGKASISPVYSIFYPTGLADSDFLGQRLVRKDFINEMVKWRQGVIYGQWRIHESDFIKIEVAVPCVEEQRKIGRLLDSIDNLITLHQRKQNWQNSRFLRKISSLILAIAWEQRKLGDVVSRFATGLNPRDNFTLNSGGKNYYVTIKNFTHGNLVLDDNCDKIDDEALALIQARSDLRIGDILFSSIGRVGDCFLIENRPINWNINESVFVLRPVKDAVDPLYLMHTIHSERVLSVILSCVTGSTFKSIKMAQLKETNIPYPNIVEQKQIGKFITAIDNLITLHQCKRAAFVSRKSPSIFQFEKWRNTLTWEQCKFEEYFEERNERSGEGELISVTINSGIKKFNELGRFDTKPEDLSKYKRVEVGDIAYNSMRMWQGASGYSPYSGILSPAYTVISPKTGVSSLFFAYLIKRPQMIHLFEINSQGLTSDTWNLKFPAFSQIEASAPTEIAEQKNIAEIFTVLDNLITLHQRQVEKLKNIKSALLEKMFV